MKAGLVNINSGRLFSVRIKRKPGESLALCVESLSSEPATLPKPFDRFSASARRSPWCTMISVFEKGDLVAEIGIATKDRCGASIWKKLGASDCGIDRPRAPWCAVRYLPGCHYPTVIGQLAIALTAAWISLAPFREEDLSANPD